MSGGRERAIRCFASLDFLRLPLVDALSSSESRGSTTVTAPPAQRFGSSKNRADLVELASAPRTNLLPPPGSLSLDLELEALSILPFEAFRLVPATAPAASLLDLARFAWHRQLRAQDCGAGSNSRGTEVRFAERLELCGVGGVGSSSGAGGGRDCVRVGLPGPSALPLRCLLSLERRTCNSTTLD